MKQFAYIYRLTTIEGLKYIGSHLVVSNKTIWKDYYHGSSSDPRINQQITCKEILCYITGYNRKDLYSNIQKIERELIHDLNAISLTEYANCCNWPELGLNSKRLGGIVGRNKQRELWVNDEEWARKTSENISRAQKLNFNKSSEWHKKGQLVSAKGKRKDWSKELYNSVEVAYKEYPNKKAYALWTYLNKPTKTYKSIFHILKNIKKGKTWKEIK